MMDEESEYTLELCRFDADESITQAAFKYKHLKHSYIGKNMRAVQCVKANEE